MATLALAEAGVGRVGLDPLVGALIVRPAGEVVGRGSHVRHGGLHAEPVALTEAAQLSRGATLYCNLEPCGYDAAEKRQPACARAILDAGIARVVIGHVDPHPSVRGSGVRSLREAGVIVDLAPDPAPFWIANADYLTRMVLGRPFAGTIDGAGGRGTASWVRAIAAAMGPIAAAGAGATSAA